MWKNKQTTLKKIIHYLSEIKYCIIEENVFGQMLKWQDQTEMLKFIIK